MEASWALVALSLVFFQSLKVRRRNAVRQIMGVLLLNLLCVVLFCLSCRGLIQALRAPLNWAGTEFSRRALRLERSYKIIAWSLLTLFLFGSMVNSFIEVFSQV